MGHSLLWMLFLLNELLHGHAKVSDKPTLTFQPSRHVFFSGERVTLSCDIQGGENFHWTYNWWTSSRADLTTPTLHHRYTIISAAESNTGEYSCYGRSGTFATSWSDTVKLSVASFSPKAILSADKKTIPVGGSVTLTCSVNPPSSSWNMYFLYKGATMSEPQPLEGDFNIRGQVRVSQGGVYFCRGGRGDPVYYTQASEAITINKTIAKKAVVTLEPNWSKLYRGEKVTVRCEIEDGGEWTYEWKSSSGILPEQSAFWVINATAYGHQNYWCKGKHSIDLYSSTDWSDSISMTVSDKRPQPVLTVSPLWLGPGSRVTLTCEVDPPSAGWSFYWYQAVPDLQGSSYSYELLSGDGGTEQGSSYIVHGQTRTAGYVCRAGRGDPVFHTDYSEPKFVWSGDFHSAASLMVSPDRVQHFRGDSVSLSCDGNSTKWRVRRFSKLGSLTDCSFWGTMTGSACTISILTRNAVFWCESETGQYSNAVNITGQNSNMILVSPVHPVAEGDSVTLVCETNTAQVLSVVAFYKNDKLIQKDTSRELTIPAVSGPDEGFYKCERKDSLMNWTSPESWVSVKLSRPGSSLFPALLAVGVVSGVLLIVLLLLLCCYRKLKDSNFLRFWSSDQVTVKQDETQCKEAPGDACVYESIKDPIIPGESTEVTYALIEFKGSAEKGTSDPAAADETIYSEVNTGTASCHSCPA